MSEGTSSFSTVCVAGFRTIVATRQQLASLLGRDCLAARGLRSTWLPKLVFSSNGQGIALAGRSAEFAVAMSKADIVHADGMPVVFASKLTGSPLPERITTTDFFHDAAREAVRLNLRFFILGASEDQNRRVVESMKVLYPELAIVGRKHGYFPPEEDKLVCEEILAAKADVVWVALGKPRQEQWCIRNRDNLRGVGWLKTCGGLYSYLTGDVTRAPMWMRRLGLEWLYRSLLEPRRLMWRYLVTNPYAVYRLLAHTRK
jgi:exopolysaccharide biosynthesis WecB/TagA/CpsF family protein